jgi:dipeptidyl-peptidase-4
MKELNVRDTMAISWSREWRILGSTVYAHSVLQVTVGILLVSLSIKAGLTQEYEVYRDRVNPNWSDDGNSFWFRSQLSRQESEFILVDAQNGVREPLFDHQQLADEINSRTDYRVRPQSLGSDGVVVTSFDPATNRVDLELPGWRLRLDRGSGEFEWEAGKRDVAGKLFLPIRASRRSGEEATLEVHNRLAQIVEFVWVTPDRKLVVYEQVQPGKSFQQNTFVGHAWLIRDQGGKQLGCFFVEDRDQQVFELNQAQLDQVENAQPQKKRSNKSADRRTPSSRRRSGNQAAPFEVFVRDHDLWIQPRGTGATGSPDTVKPATRLTEDGNAENSFHRSAQRARMMQMQYGKKDYPSHVGDVQWSRDKRYLVAWQTTVVPEREINIVKALAPDGQPELIRYPYAKAGDRIPVRSPRLFEAATGKEIPLDDDLFPDPWQTKLERFSEDLQSAWFFYNERGHQKIQIVHVELATGNSKVVIEEESSTFLHYSSAGKYKLHWIDDSTALWSSERHGWNHLCRINMKTGEILNAVTEGEWNVKRFIRMKGDAVWFLAVGVLKDANPYYEYLCKSNLDGSCFQVLTPSLGHHSITWSPDQRFFVDRYCCVDTPPVFELRKSSDGSLVCNVEQAEIVTARPDHDLRLVLPEPFAAPGRDDKTMIHGVVYWPSNFDPSKKWPIIENIYAGPHDHHVPNSFRQRRRFRELTDAGFVVVQIDGMGTAWRSKEFHDVCYRNLRDAGLPDRIAWLKALAEKYPALDLDRVGIFGGSAGGQNALAALLWHHDFYKVAVADCGCHDNRMDKIWWNEQWMGKLSPGNHYAENSNVENAHRLKGHLLLIVGGLDSNVDPSSTLQVVTRLVDANKDFDLLVIPNAGHGAGDTPYGRRRRLAFFQRHLLKD